MDDEEYVTLLSYEDEGVFGEIRLYGDRSVEFGETGAASYLTRTNPGVIREEDAQRLSIIWGRGTSRREVIVDGKIEAEWDETEYDDPVMETDKFVDWWLGCDPTLDHHYQGGIDDVRLWTDPSSEGAKTREWIFDHAFVDLVDAGVDTTNLPLYLRFDDYTDDSEAVSDGNSTDYSTTIVGASYQDSFGRLEEVTYSFGTGDTVNLDFDISGRLDTELIRTQRVTRSTRHSL